MGAFWSILVAIAISAGLTGWLNRPWVWDLACVAPGSTGFDRADVVILFIAWAAPLVAGEFVVRLARKERGIACVLYFWLFMIPYALGRLGLIKEVGYPWYVWVSQVVYIGLYIYRMIQTMKKSDS